jgi:hypothetical protein
MMCLINISLHIVLKVIKRRVKIIRHPNFAFHTTRFGYLSTGRSRLAALEKGIPR